MDDEQQIDQENVGTDSEDVETDQEDTETDQEDEDTCQEDEETDQEDEETDQEDEETYQEYEVTDQEDEETDSEDEATDSEDSKTYSEDDLMERYKWSQEMIVRSMKLVDEEVYRCLPTTFFETIGKQHIVIEHKELAKLVREYFESVTPDTTPTKSQVDECLKKMAVLRMEPTFPSIIGLCGTNNGFYPEVERILKNRTQIFAANRTWLYDIAIHYFNEKQTLSQKQSWAFPSSAKYVAIFEADKMAKKVKNHLHISINKKDVIRAVRKFSDSEFCKNIPEIPVLKDPKQVEEYLFDGTNFYLIPEYQHTEREDLKISKNRNPIPILMFKHYCRRFFEHLSAVSPFNRDSENNQHIKYTNISLPHSGLFQNAEYAGKFDPTAVNEPMLPILSPNFELLVSTSKAFYVWASCITDNYSTLDLIRNDKLNAVRIYINKFLDKFDTSKKTISYAKYIGMTEEWKKMKKELLNNPADVEKVPANQRFSAKLFKDSAHQQVKEHVLGKWLCFLAEFPKAAVIMHKLKTCSFISQSSGSSFCALHLVFYAHYLTEDNERCCLPLADEVVKMIRRKRGLDFWKTESMTKQSSIISKGKDLVGKTKEKLLNFLTLSNGPTEKKRAKLEFEEFETISQLMISRASRNLELLQTNENTEIDDLAPIQSEFPEPFSKNILSIIAATKQECIICCTDLYDGTELFCCQFCKYPLHDRCFKNWAETTKPHCPQCNKVIVDKKDVPLSQ